MTGADVRAWFNAMQYLSTYPAGEKTNKKSQCGAKWNRKMMNRNWEEKKG